ncbi:multicopper oxidase domain-containing protein, partial [Streptomyces mirabilis]|uniref:multicopper oxidase domain-containing protein n=1 Tax=Streptomyces mirabilis TaxID=68239 RepID=UPI0036839536
MSALGHPELSTGPLQSVSPSPALTARATQDLRDPAQIVSRNGLLRTRIVVERKKVRLAGRDLWALTYNGMYMPPTLRLRPGDRMEVSFENKLDHQTNLHVHGMHVSPAGHSDNVFLKVEPGKTFTYEYAFPKSLEPGTYWYHPHPHTLSAPRTAGGMSGLIVVDGLDRYLPAPLRGITEHAVALKDFQLVGDQIKTSHLKIGAPTTRTVNGQLNPRIRIRPGETQLWRLANIGANIFYKLTAPLPEGRGFLPSGLSGDSWLRLPLGAALPV